MTVRPFGSVRRIGELPKSKSGPVSSGQLSLTAAVGPQPMTNVSFGVTCFDQRIFPVFRSKAISAVVPTAGGVRNGLDVVRMLALGAKGVLLGRAWVYALAAQGEAGVTTAKRLALAILHTFGEAEAQLIGKAVILTDGTAGTVEAIWLDDFHGLRLSIKGHPRKRPVSTVKFTQE